MRRARAAAPRRVACHAGGAASACCGYAIIAAVWGALALAVVLLWFARDLPRPDAALDAARRPSLALEDRTGRVFATFGDIVGEPLRLSDMPPYLPAAAVAVEDRRFWHHPGIDPIGLARAVWVNLTSGRLVQGGSTITQQVAKNLFLTNARTFRRKVQELLLTLWLEHTFSKREILEIWLNRVYLGSGTWGVDAAARMYFGISARRVTLWQAAMLAGLPRAPSRFNPRTDPAAAAARAREVLTAMAKTGAITAEQARAAAAQIAFPPAPPLATGWFADWVADQAQSLAPENADTTVRTTLDARLQAVAEARLTALLDGPGAAAGVTQGAVVALDAATGAVRAMVGGRDYRQSSFNRAVLARRQPGSAFKPFVWLAALEKGVRPDDTVLDAPIRIGNWSPADFERQLPGRDHGRGGAGAVDQHRGRAAAAAGRRAARGGEAGGAARHRRQAAERRFAGARHRRGRAAGARRRPMPRSSMAARASRRSASRRCATAPQPRDRSRSRGDDGAHDDGGGDARHRPGGRGAGPSGRRQDRHDAGLSRRLVHRLHRWRDHRRLARQRRQPADEVGAGRRPAGTAVPRHRDRPVNYPIRPCDPRGRLHGPRPQI